MLVVLYEMAANPGEEAAFEQAWAEVTRAIHRVRGSLGSRLHRTETPGTYIAYARWPSAASFEADPPVDAYTEAESAAFARMRAASRNIRVLHKMSVCEDLWMDAVARDEGAPTDTSAPR